MVLNYILLERNLKKSCLYPQIFNLQFLCVAGYLKHSNENIDSSNDKYTNYNIIEILSQCSMPFCLILEIIHPT